MEFYFQPRCRKRQILGLPSSMKQLKGHTKQNNDFKTLDIRQCRIMIPAGGETNKLKPCFPQYCLERVFRPQQRQRERTLVEHSASLIGDADLGRKRARQLEISGWATKLKRATLSRSFEKLQSVPIKSIVSKQLFHYSISRLLYMVK